IPLLFVPVCRQSGLKPDGGVQFGPPRRNRLGPFWTCFVLIVNRLFTLAKPLRARQSILMKPGLSLTRLRWRRRFRSLLALILLGGLAFAAWIWLPAPVRAVPLVQVRSEEHTSELQSLMRISYAVFCLK